MLDSWGMCDLSLTGDCSGTGRCKYCKLGNTPKPPPDPKEVEQEKKIIQAFLDHAAKLNW